MNNAYMPKSKSVEWSTPQDFFDKLNNEFNFTVDVASTANNAKCANYYTENENGLVQNWGGQRVWCNPPYGKDMPKWIEKAYNERNNAECIVMLIPSRTDTRAFHNWIYGVAEIRFVKGRLKFGEMNQAAPFPSMVVIYRKGENENRRGETNTTYS